VWLDVVGAALRLRLDDRVGGRHVLAATAHCREKGYFMNDEDSALARVEPDRLIVTPAEARQPRAPVRLVSRETLFRQDAETLELPEGLTISEQMAAGGLNPKLAPWFHVAIDGVAVGPELWDRVRPKAGRTVAVSVLPRDTGGGGGGGGGQKDDNKTLRIVLTIVVYIAAAVLSYFFWAGAPYFFLAASAIAAGLWVLLPPPKPRGPEQDSAAQFFPSIAGARNQLRPWAPIPRLLGRHRIYPPDERTR